MNAASPNEPHAPPGPNPILHVVDDEPAIRLLFEQIAAHAGVDVRTYGNAEDFLKSVDTDAPGCLVLDVNLPGQSGLDVLTELARRRSPLPVIVISGLASVAQAVSALKLGSVDFIEKPFQKAEIVATIRKALETDQSRRASEAERQALRSRLVSLTPREREVMALVVKGHANKSIAHELGISPKTVEVHRANVMRKTGTTSVAELVRLAMTAQDAAG